MSTHFVGEGNIGSAPDYREFPNGNDEPRRLLRLNVYFDNPIPKKDGGSTADHDGLEVHVGNHVVRRVARLVVLVLLAELGEQAGLGDDQLGVVQAVQP